MRGVAWDRRFAEYSGPVAEFTIERLATKDDLMALRADVRADLKDLELRLTLRFGAMLAASVGITVALVKLL